MSEKLNFQDISEPELKKWLVDFHKVHNRSPRILHIGNVANNAYLNAKLQRKIGIESYVVIDQNHIMSSPEWEDCDFDEDWGDDFNPNWKKMDLKGYKRPDWVITGNLLANLMTIQAMMLLPQFITSKMIFFIKILCSYLEKFPLLIIIISQPILISRAILSLIIKGLKLDNSFSAKDIKVYIKKYWRFQALISTLMKEFNRLFPDRKDKLTEEDILPFIFSSNAWDKIFKYFDLVQCYGAYPIWGLLSQNTKYVALEHGTLRSFTLQDNPMHRLTALSFRKAAHSFITNG